MCGGMCIHCIGVHGGGQLTGLILTAILALVCYSVSIVHTSLAATGSCLGFSGSGGLTGSCLPFVQPWRWCMQENQQIWSNSQNCTLHIRPIYYILHKIHVHILLGHWHVWCGGLQIPVVTMVTRVRVHDLPTHVSLKVKWWPKCISYVTSVTQLANRVF